MMLEDALDILLVEDEEAHARLIQKSLSRAEIATAVTHASSGFEAIAKLEEQKFDLVLLDYSLPDWDGLELLDHLVAAGLSVVMITARGSEKVAVEAMKRGAADYLVKSTETLELLPAIIQRCATTLEARRKLAEKERLHEKLIESSSDAIIATDREGRIVVFNPGAEALSGYRQEEVIGRQLPVLYESKELAKKMMRMMCEGGGSISAFETTFKAKDGTAIPVLISASILYDDEGRESGTVGFSKDLRELKKAAEELRTLKEFNENIVRSTPHGLLAIDQNFRITLWNDAMEEMRGYTEEEVLGKVATDIFPYLVQEGIYEDYKAALEGRTIMRNNIFYSTPKGKTGYSNAKFIPLKNREGEVVGLVSIVEDVTELVQLEQKVALLQEEIEERKLIEVAKGILMRELDLSEDEGYQFIQKKSRDERKKMGEVSRMVIEFHGTPGEKKKFLDKL